MNATGFKTLEHRAAISASMKCATKGWSRETHPEEWQDFYEEALRQLQGRNAVASLLQNISL